MMVTLLMLGIAACCLLTGMYAHAIRRQYAYYVHTTSHGCCAVTMYCNTKLFDISNLSFDVAWNFLLGDFHAAAHSCCH